MVKSSKRSKKFQSKGGPQGALAKGTITKKGKLKVKRRNRDGSANAADDAQAEARRELLENERLKKRGEEDFAGKANLGDLDIDSFLKTMEDSDQEKASDDEGSDASETEKDDASKNSDSDDSAEDVNMSDEEEDIEAAEEIMKAEMEKLAENDPDFQKYLENNDSSLLEFGDDNEMEDPAENEDANGEDDNNARSGGEPKLTENDITSIKFTPKMLDTYIHDAFENHKTKALKNIISAFRSACHMADPNDDSSQKVGKFHIDSPVVFDRLMVVCLKQCHEEIHYQLLGKGASDGTEKDEETPEIDELDENKPLHPREFTKSIRWPKLKPVIKSLLTSILYLLEQAKETKLQTFILKSFSKYVQYLIAFPRILKGFLKTLTSLWSATNDSSPDYQVVRLNAFLRIRQLAVTQPFPFIEQCLKSSYLAYAKRAKFANAATVTTLLPTLTFMGNCVVELYSLDFASSYQHAFVYIRQLALHLRTALQKKTPDSFRVVYCWQYIHCLKLWTAVLASACSRVPGETPTKANEEETELLRSLVYPLTEIILGVSRLIPTSRHLPLHLQCVRLLQQLAASTERYIPTTSILLDALNLKEIMMKPKKVQSRGANVRGIRLPLMLKLPKEDTLRTTEQLDACLGEIFVLLNREVDMYRYSPSIPEFTVSICQRLRRFAKETKNGKHRAFAKGCIEVCEKHSKTATKARSLLKEAPKDIRRLEALKPKNALSMKQRYDASITKENHLETAAQPVVSESAKAKALAQQKEELKKAEKATKKRSLDAENKAKKKAKMNIEVSKDSRDFGDDEVNEGIDWSDDESGGASDQDSIGDKSNDSDYE
uniref:Nucleolar complex protein 2 homolog n=1 Tax=Eucampia antarctica TaxID=49252 RepID=A0A7S2S7C6_9STRA|mmetsp:Transcript_4043/g.3811  ORF Transcript_4043/g.3811 Transcript_4043/m.3811 type:complete len:832 (+) Transcript_4043:125-2620(+)|eukprot:CAMPEP_0197836562 /NCGR_PEP_ID=MMETSP1437-20131217/29362_1 /TAXON_ID=49252 ORGANISM="Eucampia antarctica, Strain CCMP1452" /NCGR_SAMPLE_ID=MMETSP1437 /ASSEMBLY_ACC=CAM_ASM_001096 /LENGTH=831 /DNA_ID=CAMNT_0043442835 /DNA_START=84 /DNA_END=2579 /DNA_ORIENTATION=+